MKDKVSSSVTENSNGNGKETITPEERRALNDMKEKYVITYLDKAVGTFIVICKKLYVELLEEELAKNDIYEKTNETEKSILLRHATYRENAGFKERWCRMEEVYNRLPKFKAIAKYHKKPKLVLRFLVCSKQSSTEVISKALNKVFNSMEQSMTQMWQETLEDANVPSVHFPILKNTKAVEDLARTFSHKRGRENTVHTLDFSTLYTLIDQEILVQRLSKLIDRVFERVQEHGCDRLGVGTEDALWLKREEKNKGVVFDAAKIKQALNFLVRNTKSATRLVQDRSRRSGCGGREGNQTARPARKCITTQATRNIPEQKRSKDASAHNLSIGCLFSWVRALFRAFYPDSKRALITRKSPPSMNSADWQQHQNIKLDVHLGDGMSKEGRKHDHTEQKCENTS